MATLTKPLSSKHRIPTHGFGAYQVPPALAADTVHTALLAGYRHIDSASYYANETGCGLGIRRFMHETGTPRSEIFYTTKLRNEDHGYDATKAAIEKSLALVDVGYIDLYLIHTPFPGTTAGRLGSWKAMEEAVEAGLIRSIGISNFGTHHLQELIDSNPKIMPAVGQYEVHPWNLKLDIIELCNKHGIIVEAFSPLTQGRKFTDPSLTALAAKYQQTPAKILIQWSLQKGYVPLVKSSTPERMRENISPPNFSLTPEDITSLEHDDAFLTTSHFDPTVKPLEG